jgi:guanyl-specific ribonuclease Sa
VRLNIRYRNIFLKSICLYILLCTGNLCFAQPSSIISSKSTGNLKNTFNAGSACIENIGQYGKTLAGNENMGTIKYGYEGLDMPVLFTPKGLIHLQRTVKRISRQEEEKLERDGMTEAEIERKRDIKERVITMEWIGANPQVEITAEDKTPDYHTYGFLPGKAFGYKKITYISVYPGIDIVYTFANHAKAGFEYSLIVQPGADLSVVKIKYGGDIKNIKKDADGNLLVRSDINGVTESIPVSYYGNKVLNKNTGEIKSACTIAGNEISFSFPEGYDKTKTIIIDPFVTATGNLNGVNAGKAKDVDFDYAGNIYATGGGDGTVYKLAKYNAAGVLQWTFNGSIALPSWTFGAYYGGWVVEKNTGNIYLGQGFSPTTGYRVIRISTTGLYDNYISTGNVNFNENWKMYWSCNNGSPQILVVGGGTSSNLNLGILSPPSTTITPINLTGIAGVCQDMVDMALDPTTFDMYTVFASLFVTPVINNKVYKNTVPYSAATIAWNVPSGFTVVQEAGNRPYMANNIAPYNDNSANILSINASYLYYWDGKNLKAFDKVTGNGVGTPLITANTKLMQGGIIADACNNIFVGEGNGVIKVYNFNGTTFSDAPPDITIPGFAGKSVYDLAYDESRKLIYASGDGFVGSFDVSAYCPTTAYTINVVPNCVTASATATVSPVPPPGSTITYVLYIGTTQIATNTTGIFTGLRPNIIYTITATINLACSGTQATNTFVIPGPTIGITKTNTNCGASTGTITATGSGTPGPYTYNINGGPFQPTGNFTGLAAGIYTIIVKDAGGCPNDTLVTILNSNGPVFTFIQTNADCGSNNGTVTVTATGGTPPYQYSINGGVTYQSNNFFTGLLGGQYILMVKDATSCTNATIVTITSSPSPLITAIPAAATCGNNNGTITAFGSGGTGALLYSINGNTFQVSNFFPNLTPGVYTVTVKDANGCTKTTTVTVDNFPAPTVTATATSAACNNVNGTITATGNGGLAPLQYSINGVTFQTSNIFTGLAAGTYTVTVKDATGCTNITTVTVISVGGPSVTATSTVSVCNANTGTITATASGGVPAYQYSTNGLPFQASNVFTGLAAGNYVVLVRDANGCIGTFSIVISNTAGPSISVSVTPTACAVNNGTITITASGGLAPYQYSIDGITYGAAFVFTGLGAGIYTVYVKDVNGCIKSATVIVLNVSGLSLAVSTIVTSCNTNNGIITATATGGVAPLTYSIDGVSYFAGNIFTGLAAGVYTVYVKDANGCIVTKQATVASVPPPSLNVTVQQNTTCGTASGVIIATGSGGLAPLSYNIDGGAFQPTGIFINVAAGVHTIIVKDATGCTSAPQSVTVAPSAPGTAPTNVTFTVVDVLACTGEGRIKNLKGIPNGGGNTYTFSLDGGAFTTANQFRPVSIGTHTITAKNQNGCTVTRLATIGVGVPATATATSTSSACGASTGTITITGVGVNVPYHANIDGAALWQTFFPPGASSFTFTGLVPGTHTIIIADDADFTVGPPDIPGACLTTIFVTVPSTGGPTISTTQINPTCTSSNGSITVTGGGVAPLSYNINGGPYFASGTFNNLAPGNYAVTVKDGNGCTNGANITLANPSVPTVTAIIQSTSCNLNNGTITATGTGGTAPLKYSIDGTIFQSSNIFTNLVAGSYTLYVKDANECYGTLPVTIAVTPLPLVTAYTIAATCNNNDGSIVTSGSGGTIPYTYSINGTVYQSSNTFSNLSAGFYTVYIKDARDCITTTGVTVQNIGAPTITNTTTPATCGNANGSITITATGGTGPYEYSKDGITFQAGNVFTGLLPGTYTITVRDANGCIITKVIVVVNINGPQILTAVIVNAACGLSNGTITATASGGTAPLQYSLDGITYQAANIFNGVTAGGYTLYVRDINLCIKTLAVTVSDLPGPALTATSSPASCALNDGTITAIATGGTLLLTYSKDGITFQASNIFLGLAAGPFTITVKDARGCTGTFNITVSPLGTPVTPTFNPVAPICSGTTLAPLPTTSLNGITGTWLPALNNTATTTYTFTPTPGQCATTTTLTITVNPKPGPIIIYHN